MLKLQAIVKSISVTANEASGKSWSLSAGIASTIKQTRRPSWDMPPTSGSTATRSTVVTHGTGRAPQGVRCSPQALSPIAGNRPAGDEREGEREDKPQNGGASPRVDIAAQSFEPQQSFRLLGQGARSGRHTRRRRNRHPGFRPSRRRIRALPVIGAGASQIRQFVSLRRTGTPLRTAAGRWRGSSATRIATVAPSRAGRESSER